MEARSTTKEESEAESEKDAELISLKSVESALKEGYCCQAFRQKCGKKKEVKIEETDSFLMKYSSRPIPGDEEMQNINLFSKQFWKSGVIDPTSNFFYNWSMLNMLAVFYNSTVLMLRCVFIETQDPKALPVWRFFDYLCDAIYIFDMFVRSRKTFYEQGLFVKDVNRLVKRYVKSWTFVLDIITILPTDINSAFGMSGVDASLRLIRIGRIRRMVDFFHMAESRSNKPNFVRVFNLIIYVLLMVHFNACNYYGVSMMYPWRSDMWVFPSSKYLTTNETEFTFWNKYTFSFYWSTLTLTTIGDTQFPITKLQTVYCIVATLFGVFIFATIFGNVGAMINNMDKKRTECQNKVDNVREFMNIHKVAADVQLKIISWFNYAWKSKATEDAEALKYLPEKIRAEMGIFAYVTALRNLKLFQTCETGLLDDLVLRMKVQLFSPGDYVCRKGDPGRELYIVKTGYLHILADDGSIVAKLAEGQIFGEIAVLEIPGNTLSNRRMADVQAVGFVELLCLSKKDLWVALRDYPEAKKILIEKGKTILRRNKCLDEEAAQKATKVMTVVDHLNNIINMSQEQNEALEEQIKDLYEQELQLNEMDNILNDIELMISEKIDLTDAPELASYLAYINEMKPVINQMRDNTEHMTATKSEALSTGVHNLIGSDEVGQSQNKNGQEEIVLDSDETPEASDLAQYADEAWESDITAKQPSSTENAPEITDSFGQLTSRYDAMEKADNHENLTSTDDEWQNANTAKQHSSSDNTYTNTDTVVYVESTDALYEMDRHVKHEAFADDAQDDSDASKQFMYDTDSNDWERADLAEQGLIKDDAKEKVDTAEQSSVKDSALGRADEAQQRPTEVDSWETADFTLKSLAKDNARETSIDMEQRPSTSSASTHDVPEPNSDESLGHLVLEW